MQSSEEHIAKKHKNPLALLIIDMINTLDFPEGELLLKRSLPAARAIVKLKQRFKDKDLPVIYVNDNFGQWQSNWKDVYHLCACAESRGRDLAQMLCPSEDDYFVLKPKHSGFYSTTLDVLLKNLGAEKLVLTGIAGNICVLFTANDAHMRNYEVIVPEDCIASNTEEDDAFVLRQLKTVFGIETKKSDALAI